MIETKYLILGAGIGGLSTGAWLKDEDYLIVDGCDSVPVNLHNGIHYLHSKPHLPFEFDLKEITLTDGIFHENGDVDANCTLNEVLNYSEKVREIQHPCSIMNVGNMGMAYLTKDNTLNSLIERFKMEIPDYKFRFGMWFQKLDKENKIAYFEKDGEKYGIRYKYLISTIPLDKLYNGFGEKSIELKSKSIFVTNFKVDKIVPNWIINIYIPRKDTSVYRVSMLNNACSMESVEKLSSSEIAEVIRLMDLFHIDENSMSQYEWKTGKVISIDTDTRERIVTEMMQYEVYTLGRFGLWNRKILIDKTIKQSEAIVKHLTCVEPLQLKLIIK